MSYLDKLLKRKSKKNEKENPEHKIDDKEFDLMMGRTLKSVNAILEDLKNDLDNDNADPEGDGYKMLVEKIEEGKKLEERFRDVFYRVYGEPPEE